ncbi:MAG: exonuclease SbcCD subunit D C-terminal domain-containing protein [Planctomycetaceae bacterium]|nr:exonuclease SbcCD subunit D C-terminal domain-containing protein [Planctomycetaceae bacterium]
MFTIFHTADWHLGQSFCGYDRDYEHCCFLDWLLAELQSQRPDALIVAGDVFDSINPSAVAQKRFYNFLAKACTTSQGLQIVLTAGNHDAGARLEAPAGLLESFNISVVGTVKQDETGKIDVTRFLVPLKAQNGSVQAIAMAVPFLRPSDVPFVDNAADPYLDGVRELYRQTTEAADVLRTTLNPNAALIALGHCHLQGGEESRDSERRLVIGGAEAIRPDAFDPQIAYVALGHLHRAQQFDGGRIRYSGSPIPLSFAEASYRHQISKLTFKTTQLISAEEIAIPRTAMLLRIPATGPASIDDVLAQIEALQLAHNLPPEQHPFVEVRVTEEGPDPLRRRRVEQAIEGKPLRLASIKVESAKRDAKADVVTAATPHVDLKAIDPEDIFQDAWREKYGNDPDMRVLEAFREILLQEARG